MAETAPYIFDLDNSIKQDLLSRVRENLRSTAEVTYKDKTYRYGIIAASYASKVHRFVGMPGGNNLFASEEIPPEDLLHSLRHEIECNRLRAGEIGRCRTIEQELLEQVTDPEIRAHLVETRFATFEGLCAIHAIDLEHPPAEGLGREIFETRQFLAEEMRQIFMPQDELACIVGVPRERLYEALYDWLQPGSDQIQHVLDAVQRVSEPHRAAAQRLVFRFLVETEWE